jgi:hypothetical protein
MTDRKTGSTCRSGRRMPLALLAILIRALAHLFYRSLQLSSGIAGPHERAVRGAAEEPRVHQRVEKSLRGDGVESPEPAGLRRRQSQTRHFPKLALDPLECLFDRTDALVRHVAPPGVCVMRLSRPREQRSYQLISVASQLSSRTDRRISTAFSSLEIVGCEWIVIHHEENACRLYESTTQLSGHERGVLLQRFSQRDRRRGRCSTEARVEAA